VTPVPFSFFAPSPFPYRRRRHNWKATKPDFLGSTSSFRGMSWDSYGEWHVDHVRPCSLFDQRDAVQFAECWALSNLQPLWAEDNVRKGNRI
jgi:hypothetical protein